ncbi:hypothetical protein [Candidatus Chlorohelix sp.]|uniref:hypothetical protein n=1 Tax=Candidatus Chlorohelix sp. TaxID=3139201 RepID=UPI0030509298
MQTIGLLENISNKRTRFSKLIPEWIQVLLAYTFLTILITWPLLPNMGTHLVNSTPTSDAYQHIWYNWWYERSRNWTGPHTN